MSWSASLLYRVLIAWPRRHAKRPRSPVAPYRDVLFADPAAVEDDYWRMRAQ